MTEKEGVRVIRPVRSERSVPGYKTGKNGQDRQGRPPRLADADTTDTEVALIPITDREGPTREGRALSLVCLGGWHCPGTAVHTADCRHRQGRKGSCDGPRLPGTYVTNLAGAQVFITPKKAETRHAPGELIREGDKGARQGRPLLLPRGTVPSRGTPKIALLFPKVVTGPLGTLPQAGPPFPTLGWLDGWDGADSSSTRDRLRKQAGLDMTDAVTQFREREGGESSFPCYVYSNGWQAGQTGWQSGGRIDGWTDGIGMRVVCMVSSALCC